MAIAEMIVNDNEIIIQRCQSLKGELNEGDILFQHDYGDHVEIIHYASLDPWYRVAVQYDETDYSKWDEVRAILAFELIRFDFLRNPKNIAFFGCAYDNTLGLTNHETYLEDVFKIFTEVFKNKDMYYEINITQLRSKTPSWFIQMTKNPNPIYPNESEIMVELVNIYYEISEEHDTGFED